MKLKFLSIIILFTILNSICYAKIETVLVKLKIFPSNYSIKVDSAAVTPDNYNTYYKTIRLSKAPHKIRISAPGFMNKTIYLDLTKNKKNVIIEEKLEKSESLLSLVKEIKSGIQPKSVEFSPDGKYFLSALLLDKGIEVFSVETLQKIKTIQFPDKIAKMKGFVEIAFVTRLGEIWVSQMTTNMIHVIKQKNFTYLKSFNTKGNWPKVITLTDDEKLAFISNWSTEDISVIDVDKHQCIKKIKMAGIPRGMAVTPDNQYLYVAIFDNGGPVQKINLKNFTLEKTINLPRGAKRHIVLDKRKNVLYISDMSRGSIFVLSLYDDKIIKEIWVDKKINTIKLSSDGKYLFASSRGPNGPDTYLNKGPIFGKVFIINTDNKEIIESIWGRNQPTGLAISPDDKYLAFTDFLDANIEIYQIIKRPY